MPTFLTLLGPPRVEHDGAILPLLPERRGQLLALLALRRGWVARSELAAMFWPRQRSDLAAANLRKAIHFARASPWAAALEAQGSVLRFAVATDVHEVERAQREGRIVDALERCRGVLLDGMDDPSSPAWTEWLDGERAEHARRWHELTRARLAQLAATPQQGAAFASGLLDADPLDEDAIVALLGAQLATGQVDQQRETYRRFAVRLDEELGVEPSLRVRRLLRDAVPPAPAHIAPSSKASDGFYGRARELEELPAMLARAECRLLTVIGPGGVGKSSLLKRALRRLEVRYDGAFWIALDDLSANAQVIARIATELKLVPGEQQEPLLVVCAKLRSTATLLVLDNCEHLAELPLLIERLLHQVPSLHICATSRARLGVAGERLLPLQGLALPAGRIGADDPLASDAAQLFVAAAVQAQPDFDARAQAAAIGALVLSVGGLPLAILLAAHWVRHLPVAEIVAELQRSLDVLDSGDDGEERPEHRSMRATLERSWQVLSAREQQVLATLSVFVGTFSRQAASDVADAALPLLAALSDKSLLQLPADGRCSLHTLIRQFAREKLEAFPAAAASAAQRHAEWFHRFLARISASADDLADAEIVAELENSRLAWRWAIAQGSTASLAGSALALMRHFDLHNRAEEGQALLHEAVPLCSRPEAAPGHAAIVFSALAHLQHRLHRLDQAAESARSGLKLARIARDGATLSRCLNTLAICYWHWGRVAEAKRLVEQSLRNAEAARDMRGAAGAQMLLGILEKALGRHEQARLLLLESLAQERERQNWGGMGFTLINLTALQFQLGVARLPGADWNAARSFLDEGFAICETHDLAYLRPYLLVNLALVDYECGLLDAAEQNGSRALAAARDGAIGAVEVHALLHLARVALRRSQGHPARAWVGEAIGRARALQNRRLQLDCVACVGEVLAAEGDRAAAAALGRYFSESPDIEPIDRAMLEARLPGIDLAAGAPIDTPFDALIRRIAAEIAAVVPAGPA